MTSLEIAELTGKQHFHVMEAIRKMEPAWEKVAASNFRLGSYKDLNVYDRGLSPVIVTCHRSHLTTLILPLIVNT